MSKGEKLGFLIMIAFALSSCGTARIYDGPRRNDSEVAHLIVFQPVVSQIKSANIFIADVDNFFRPRQLAKRTSVELLPGHHQIEVGHVDAPVTCELSFEAEAGVTYWIVEKEGDDLSGAFLLGKNAATDLMKSKERIECVF